jgi:hypothetical protein
VLVEQRCSLNVPDFLHDWLEYKALLPLWPVHAPRSLKSPGLGVAATPGLPMFTDARCCGLARAACAC